MGYTTEFAGSFEFNRPVEEDVVTFVNSLANTRRMMRDPEIIKQIDPDWAQHCFRGNLGEDGEFYTAPDELPITAVKNVRSFERGDSKMVKSCMGQLNDLSVLNYNCPPKAQPGLWDQWVIEDGSLVWDGGEKFYNYVEWLQYLIDKVFNPLGYKLNGTVKWQGEDMDDRGLIIVDDNTVQTVELE